MPGLTLVLPNGDLLKKVKKGLNEDDRTMVKDLAAIKNWLKQQPHLPDEWEQQCLLTFLRGCNYSLEKTKRKLDFYFTMRAACPEFFANRDISRPELKDLFMKAEGPTLPGLTPEGRRVTIYRGHDKSVQADQLNDAFKIAFMIADVRLMEEVTGVAGEVFILDASIISTTHLAKLSPAIIKKFFICVQEAYPAKLKEVHIVNMSPLIDILLSIVKPFLKDKIKKRIHIHTNFSSLHKYVPKDMLPPDYGGTGRPVHETHKAWGIKLLEYRDWFKKQDSLKSNEALRPGKPKNYDEMFGIDGSFRQLTID